MLSPRILPHRYNGVNSSVGGAFGIVVEDRHGPSLARAGNGFDGIGLDRNLANC